MKIQRKQTQSDCPPTCAIIRANAKAAFDDVASFCQTCERFDCAGMRWIQAKAGACCTCAALNSTAIGRNTWLGFKAKPSAASSMADG